MYRRKALIMSYRRIIDTVLQSKLTFENGICVIDQLYKGGSWIRPLGIIPRDCHNNIESKLIGVNEKFNNAVLRESGEIISTDDKHTPDAYKSELNMLKAMIKIREDFITVGLNMNFTDKLLIRSNGIINREFEPDAGLLGNSKFIIKPEVKHQNERGSVSDKGFRNTSLDTWLGELKIPILCINFMTGKGFVKDDQQFHILLSNNIHSVNYISDTVDELPLYTIMLEEITRFLERMQLNELQ